MFYEDSILFSLPLNQLLFSRSVPTIIGTSKNDTLFFVNDTLHFFPNIISLYKETIDSTNAAFTRFGDKMELTSIKINNPLKGEILKDRINKAQACFQKLGIQCIVDLENIK